MGFIYLIYTFKIKLFLLFPSLRQNNQKLQNDTVEPIVEVIGSPIIKELLQNPFIVDNKQDNVLSKPPLPPLLPPPPPPSPPLPSREELHNKEYRFAQVL